MTETFLRAVAERYGLAVLKRVQTGSSTRHFADFELTHPDADLVRHAWEVTSMKGRGPAFDRLTYTDNPDHEDCGKPFIECKSVWCECSEETPTT
jgi:hypothetical protein